jgi:NADPH-dependent curcumin reductase CurA
MMMNSRQNMQWVFLSRPKQSGASLANFELQECGMPAVKDGQVLVASHLFSVDPTMRNAMAGPQVATSKQHGIPYYEMMNWQVGAPPSGSIIGYVVESKAAEFQPGDMIKVPQNKRLPISFE